MSDVVNNLDPDDTLDLSEYIGPLDAEPEPKTLEECLAEAGGFPFVARAVRPGLPITPVVLPVGVEWRFDGWSKNLNTGYMTGPEARQADKYVNASVKRWVLVGHRT